MEIIEIPKDSALAVQLESFRETRHACERGILELSARLNQTGKDAFKQVWATFPEHKNKTLVIRWSKSIQVVVGREMDESEKEFWAAE